MHGQPVSWALPLSVTDLPIDINVCNPREDKTAFLINEQLSSISCWVESREADGQPTLPLQGGQEGVGDPYPKTYVL